ncbi:MAG: phospho-N-acetylmuramoyl-pentapeptide-transferase, partial [Lachnospiraceae bacterium]|nr:phospho-N-acetylmuramoyl-pentapeptide-transferase [Lachnospiraceae bacterium]
MFHLLFPDSSEYVPALLGIVCAFAATIFFTAKLQDRLPKDGGRDFAHDGKLSAGKPRGAGIIFVLAYVVAALLFLPFSAERLIYLILLTVCMLTGFLDDAAKSPWGEYKKGILDLGVAILLAITYLVFNGSETCLAIFGVTFTMPAWLFAILTVVLAWASVNVTNCADGVDGLSGTLTIISLLSILALDLLNEAEPGTTQPIVIFCAVLLAYLWFNATPSKLMMGDAGSRAMGLFIAIAILKSGCPFLYIPLALVLILDGGLGLIKVSLIRFAKIHIMKNVRTPLHDHVRKLWNWSNTQCVYRF